MDQSKGKKDYRFLIILSVLLVIFTVGGLWLQKISRTTMPDTVPLPEDADESRYYELVISEVMTNNGGAYIAENGMRCDYAELFNGSSQRIHLLGYGLSDRTDKIKWAFPDIYIEPGEYLVVNLTGRDEDGLNASFRLTSSGGEELILVNAKSKVIDAVKTVSMDKNQCMIRNGREWVIPAGGAGEWRLI